MSAPIVPGTFVRLRTRVKRHPVPEGRTDNRSATVLSVDGGGGRHLNRDLNGMRWWHVTDLQPVGVWGCKLRGVRHLGQRKTS